MARMIDLIRQSAVPAHLMRAAAKGALNVPPEEMVEILVLLTKNPVFREQARLTLAGWDESTSRAVAADSKTPPEVLQYMLHPENRRPSLLPGLLENPSVSESALAQMAVDATRTTMTAFLESPRVRKSESILRVLISNPNLPETDAEIARKQLADLQSQPPDAGTQPDSSDTTGSQGTSELVGDEETDNILAEFTLKHADEIAAEEGKAFRLVGSSEDELEVMPEGTDLDSESIKPFVLPAMGESPAPPPEGFPADAATAATADAATSATAAAAKKAVAKPPEQKRAVSVLQKIARLSVGERVQLAMKGNKDERFILIRDGAKIVALAVLESPKLTDTEAERFAAMKNIQDAVLRAMAGKRKFMKLYPLIRNLVFNPKCPIDVSLALLPHMLLADLKNLSMNKEVSDTVRKAATRLFAQRADTRKARD
jgi:hypothetical protein